VPPFRYEQHEVVPWIRSWLEAGNGAGARLLGVYDSAGVARRASVIPIEEVFTASDFESKNERYCSIAKDAASELCSRALRSAGVPAADVRAIVSVSCTGFMIPAVDAFVADALSLGPRLVRLPITESGCAGGVVGLARAADFLAAHPDGAALVLALEFASLTFQHWDRSPANVVSAAIFGDGAAAAVLVGREHPLARAGGGLEVLASESLFFPNTTHLMGFRLRNQGLQIVLDKDLVPFLQREVKDTVGGFLERHLLRKSDVARFILHPGGRRIVETLAEELDLASEDLAATQTVLSEHGNMSSVTVLFVLDEIRRCRPPSRGALGLLGAFGPGFGAELLLLRFD
jgi:alkylresorcinol/alkylpyrone synthase